MSFFENSKKPLDKSNKMCYNELTNKGEYRESANSAVCKTVPFEGSGVGTHLSHQFKSVKKEADAYDCLVVCLA